MPLSADPRLPLPVLLARGVVPLAMLGLGPVVVAVRTSLGRRSLHRAVPGDGDAPEDDPNPRWAIVIRPVTALALFAAAHSALAARPTKRRVGGIVGPRAADGLYRSAYVALALASSGVLARSLWRLPDRPLYRVGGPVRVVLIAGQTLALLQTLAVARAVGPARFVGWPQLRAYLAGGPVAPPVVAQHPPAEGSALAWGGPFRWCRHPNNAFPLLAWWLSPTMTAKWAAVGAGAAVYMLLGSWHEERRQAADYGERFDRYRQEVPHLLLPLAGLRPPEPGDLVAAVPPVPPLAR